MNKARLIIGNKAYSSWSLRAWLGVRLVGLEIEEVVIPLDRPETPALLGRESPTRHVPVLDLDGTVVFDSLAILETLADRFPAAGLWPEDWRARAEARALAAAMHSGYTDLRRDMPMDLKRARPGCGHTPGALGDIADLAGLWRRCRARWGGNGPFLFGGPGAVDAMFAPVVTRLATYGVALDDDTRAYCTAIESLPAMRDWRRAALAEPWVIDNPCPPAAWP